jgi:hypothetical protein
VSRGIAAHKPSSATRIPDEQNKILSDGFADYWIVGDLFKVLPELSGELDKLQQN